VFFLQILSLIYGGLVAVRNYLYDRGFLRVKRLPLPVLSVGNLSSGGTGKTSLVRYLAQELGKTYRVAVLLRGYKRRSKGTLVVSEWGSLKVGVEEAGDEAYLLGRLLPKASVVVSEDRFVGGLVAVRDLGAELLILDDGFQHRRLHRDLDIVLVRKRDLQDRLLPAGFLREGFGSLSRADAVVLSYQEVEPFELKLEGKPVFRMFRRFNRLLSSRFEEVPLETLRGKKVVAFAGLGSNEQFFRVIEGLGVELEERLSFPDHHHYRGFKLEEGKVYLTTLKDLVKLPPAENLFALDFEVEVEGLLDFVRERLPL